jgi:hypothetical protein
MKSINADERIAVHFVESDIRRDGRLIDLSQRTPSLVRYYGTPTIQPPYRPSQR